MKIVIKKAESDECGPSDIAESWLELRNKVKSMPGSQFGASSIKKEFEVKLAKYMQIGLTGAHFAAVLLLPDRERLKKIKSWMLVQEVQLGVTYLTQCGVDQVWLFDWLSNGADALSVSSHDNIMFSNLHIQLFVKNMERMACYTFVSRTQCDDYEFF